MAMAGTGGTASVWLDVAACDKCVGKAEKEALQAIKDAMEVRASPYLRNAKKLLDGDSTDGGGQSIEAALLALEAVRRADEVVRRASAQQ